MAVFDLNQPASSLSEEDDVAASNSHVVPVSSSNNTGCDSFASHDDNASWGKTPLTDNTAPTYPLAYNPHNENHPLLSTLADGSTGRGLAVEHDKGEGKAGGTPTTLLIWGGRGEPLSGAAVKGRRRRVEQAGGLGNQPTQRGRVGWVTGEICGHSPARRSRLASRARVVFDMVPHTTKYTLTTFDVEYNHVLDRVEYKHLSKAKRNLTYNEQLFIIKAANANIGAVRAHNLYTGLKGSSSLVHGTQTEFKNFTRGVNCFIGDSDAQMLHY
ncbi:hypothetical protein Tco_0355181 [Tanacetum coccineum]